MDTRSRQNKFRRLWLPVAGATMAILVLGAWLFKTDAPSTTTTWQTEASLEDVILSEADRTTALDELECLYQKAGYIDLLNFLHKKRLESDWGVLAALVEIAHTRPELAINLAQALGRTDEEKAYWIKELAKLWAKRNPPSAWEWLAQQSSIGNRVINSPLVGVIMDAMASSDPEMLVANIDSLLLHDHTSGPLAARNSVYLGLQALVKNGQVELARATVEEWANGPYNATIGIAAYEIVALGMDRDAPENAGAWLRSLPNSQERNLAIGTFAINWGQSAPAAAIRWAETLSPGEGQAEAVSRVFSQWMQSDAESATNWLDGYISKHPAQTGADLIIGSLVLFSPAVKDDPAAALQLIRSVSDPKKQAVYEAQIFQAWGRRDLASAIEYVRASPMIEVEKLSLIQKICHAQAPDQAEE